MKIKFSATTDTGLVRDNNEDAVSVCPDLSCQEWILEDTASYLPIGTYGAMMVVADGMGGANAGEIASSIVINTVKSYFTKDRLQRGFLGEQSIHGMLAEAVSLSQDAIMDYVQKNPNSNGLGTTVVITWVMNSTAYIAWCGDSRTYCYNPKSGLKRLTKDHSYVQELMDRGELTSKQAFNHPDSNIITKCLGDVDMLCEPDFVKYEIGAGDILLSCSDGLCGYCKDKDIEKIMMLSFDNLSHCKTNLLKLALNAGGQDNITIALCATLPDDESTPIISCKTRIKRLLERLV